MTVLDYRALKDQVVQNIGQSENYSHLLNKLKDFYKDDIDSERKFERINSIRQLINILEVREVLSEDNVGPLKEIARRLNDSELMSSISEFEMNHVPRQYINYYAIEDAHIPLKKETKESFIVHNPFSNVSNTKRKRMRDTIIEEIGPYWRDLGRNLKIQERKIQDIDNMYNRLSDKATGLMDIFEDRADPQRWYFVLCEALEKSRRKDICKTLHEIMGNTRDSQLQVPSLSTKLRFNILEKGSLTFKETKLPQMPLSEAQTSLV